MVREWDTPLAGECWCCEGCGLEDRVGACLEMGGAGGRGQVGGGG